MAIWIRKFKCVCGKWHTVEGQRYYLGKLKKRKEKACLMDIKAGGDEVLVRNYYE